MGRRQKCKSGCDHVLPWWYQLHARRNPIPPLECPRRRWILWRFQHKAASHGNCHQRTGGEAQGHPVSGAKALSPPRSFDPLGGRCRMPMLTGIPILLAMLVKPKLSDSVDSHRARWGLSPHGPPQSFPRPSRTAAGTAQILPESPARLRPTTAPAAAAGEEVIDTPGALAKPGCLLRRPLRRQTPAGPSAKAKIRIAQFR
jgi:hypothetical protein